MFLNVKAHLGLIVNFKTYWYREMTQMTQIGRFENVYHSLSLSEEHDLSLRIWSKHAV